MLSDAKSIYHTSVDQFVNIPAELKTLPNWVCWKLESRGQNEKPTKVPYHPSGTKSKANDPSTWTNYPDCVKAAESGQFDGVGFEFTSPYVGVDLDKCRDPQTGMIETWAQEIIDDLQSYTELSPSGTGVHIIVKGKLPAGGRRKDRLEMYSSGRYFTMTGQELVKGGVNERTDELSDIHTRIFHSPVVNAAPATPNDSDIDELIYRASLAKNGEKFDRLYTGDTSDHQNDHSVADMAFCQMLAFWTGRDAAKMDVIFRESGLMRPKWDERHGTCTYGQMTIQTAIERTTETYTPGYNEPSGHEPSKPPSTSVSDILSHLEANAPWKTPRKQTEYLIEPEIPKGAVIMISGAPASGKSTLVLDWCITMATNGQDVLYLDRDNGEQVIQERFAKYPQISDHFRYWGLWHTDPNGEPLEPPLLESPLLLDCIKSLNAPVVVFDTLNSFSDGDENDNTVMGRTYKAFRKLCVTHKATIIIVHHTTKDGNSEYRGASAQGGAVDMGWKVTGKKDNLGRLTFADVTNWKTKRADGSTVSYQFDENGTPKRVTKTFQEHLYDLLVRNPGLSEAKFEALAKKELNSSRSATRDFIDRYKIAGKLKIEGKARSSKLYAIERCDPKTASLENVLEDANEAFEDDTETAA